MSHIDLPDIDHLRAPFIKSSVVVKPLSAMPLTILLASCGLYPRAINATSASLNIAELLTLSEDDFSRISLFVNDINLSLISNHFFEHIGQTQPPSSQIK